MEYPAFLPCPDIVLLDVKEQLSSIVLL